MRFGFGRSEEILDQLLGWDPLLGRRWCWGGLLRLPTSRRRESTRVGALEQLVPGMLVEAALGPSVPLAVVEHDAPDEALPVVARRMPALGQEQEG